MKWVFCLLIGFIIGFNVGGQGKTLKYLWNKDEDGMISLNRKMQKDKSHRLVACIITENETHNVSALDPKKFGLRCEIVKLGV